MIYIADSNTDPKRKLPNKIDELGDETLVAQLGGVIRLLALMDCDGLPSWQKFATEGTADADTIAGMIEECEKDEELKALCLDGLKAAVAPIFVAED
jgi:hypothetical protein